MRTPEARSVSLGVKRELFAGMAISADGVYSRGYNQFNNRDLNPRDPATGTRPNPNYLRITQYETEGNAWYQALLVSLERRGADLARRLASLPPTSVRATKRLMRAPLLAAIDNAMAAENAAFAECLAAPEFGEALAAFLEKRAPDFSRC